ncbi:hypothetical protein PHMEG_00035532 [Phytophthora megakarya]|uniref:Reverse transcriptase RNase H-like domain-containing protein n=1 Tax=Phytophthora megakarya TaxID=4795 RepID=A0A225UNL4_9STRA|nr:hypothetical protein PHMEG_00035532 [Phytophthora megakarya]
MFTDTSDIGYSIVGTPVADWKDELQAKELQYQLLGTSQLNWSIVEKEAFPIVQSCTTLEYLLQRSNDFKLYCDHANLISIFAPDKDLKKHARANLQRWAMLLTDASDRLYLHHRAHSWSKQPMGRYCIEMVEPS